MSIDELDVKLQDYPILYNILRSSKYCTWFETLEYLLEFVENEIRGKS